MDCNLTITEQLMYSTIRIECELRRGSISTGTGFLFRFLENGEEYIPAIVTNKHVVRGALNGSFIFTVADENGKPIDNKHERFSFNDFEKYWIMHPDPNVDLCIMPIAPILKSASTREVDLFLIYLDKKLIPSNDEVDDLTAMEDIVMIGYPNGIWDSVNNQPILRRGITATHPKLNYEGKEEFMIDAACFPGSSGSPVLLLNMGSFPMKDGGIGLGNRVILLGVLYAGPQHTARGDIKIMNIPIRQEPISISRIPNNLGCVIKSKKIMEFEDILKNLFTKEANE